MESWPRTVIRCENFTVHRSRNTIILHFAYPWKNSRRYVRKVKNPNIKGYRSSLKVLNTSLSIKITWSKHLLNSSTFSESTTNQSLKMQFKITAIAAIVALLSGTNAITYASRTIPPFLPLLKFSFQIHTDSFCASRVCSDYNTSNGQVSSLFLHPLESIALGFWFKEKNHLPIHCSVPGHANHSRSMSARQSTCLQQHVSSTQPQTSALMPWFVLRMTLVVVAHYSVREDTLFLVGISTGMPDALPIVFCELGHRLGFLDVCEGIRGRRYWEVSLIWWYF